MSNGKEQERYPNLAKAREEGRIDGSNKPDSAKRQLRSPARTEQPPVTATTPLQMHPPRQQLALTKQQRAPISFTVWRCEVCGGIAQFYPNEAESGTQIVCGGFECNGLMSQVEVIPLATHQALEARLERAVHIVGVLRQDMRPGDPFIVGVDEFLSAFNNQPTGTEGGD